MKGINMKNYLFEPFKKKIEKINAFNVLKSTIISCIDEKNVNTSYAITPLIIFVGKLESYYDAMMGESEKAWMELCNGRVDKDYHNSVYDEVEELKAENERLKKGFGHGVLVELEQVDSLKEEIESLQDQLKEAVNGSLWS